MSQPNEWIVEAIKTDKPNGIKRPIESEASWTLGDVEWIWLKLEIKDIRNKREGNARPEQLMDTGQII